MNIKQEIKDFALSIGFSQIGFARAEALDVEFINYMDSLKSGFNGSMKYLEKNLAQKQNPLEILPEAKTVIVAAWNYFVPVYHPKDGFGKISRYAWGKDYHITIKNKLKLVSEKIQGIVPGSENRIFCDSNSVLEKAWAVRAGIGWQGKNCLILNKKFGSFFFLGIIITSVYLEPDKRPEDNHCGDCRLCIEACPTNALREPGVLDSRKCISYWSIEEKNIPFPASISENLNGWIYGCDICQDVCPWNGGKAISKDFSFMEGSAKSVIEPETVLTMNKDAFFDRFSATAVIRAGLEKLKENAQVLVANKKNKSG